MFCLLNAFVFRPAFVAGNPPEPPAGIRHQQSQKTSNYFFTILKKDTLNLTIEFRHQQS